MKGGNIGLLCRSQSATVVCFPEDPRLMILSRLRNRTLNSNSSRQSGDRRSVTLSMVTKNKECLSSPYKPSSSSNHFSSINPPSTNHVFQVVVMRVSLHCKGCAGKVRKHISKMEGVTSFSIDLESKRVTVMGHVSPAGVLESISKVKRAEFWPC
ncbi:protein SODIUM POTASSIUM ROOT DEFECTIVE 1-like isoform X2 [Canna indica]|uniref:Protein SODIUM POTASSIUM ROOT DEFECTIVE 1-like isoform X2 n=1 Tax=Canna indica TaxID=4628 RepID=A0AAQ3KUN1_9LILI|nr:protein SODIUM POTASSIUM ROOT DEFECTIVE 1-like isoform X2 [Canna indica]